MQNTLNLLIIGLGPHAKNTYIPALKSISLNYNISIKGIVEYKKNKSSTLDFLKTNDLLSVKFIEAPVRKLNTSYKLSNEFETILNIFVKENNIRAIIISTEPISHKQYIQWALNNNLNILVDKPLTVHCNSSTDITSAKKIEEDFYEIVNISKTKFDLLTKKPLIFSCFAQKRYQEPYLEMREMVKEVFEITNCPITTINIVNNDGQLRFLKEILSVIYHGFKEGIGKLSHTGYHFIDIIPWLLKHTQNPEKPINRVSVHANFTRPKDIINILEDRIIYELFDDTQDYSGINNINIKKIKKKLEYYGEIDAHINYIFYNDKNKICTANLCLLHSGVSFRTWIDTYHDPLANIGRSKQQQVTIFQGPFMMMQYSKFSRNTLIYSSITNENPEYNQLIAIFNNKILSDSTNYMIKKEYQQKRINGKLPIEEFNCVKEFILSVLDINKNDLSSKVQDHESSIKLFSGAYTAGAMEFNNDFQPLIIDIKL